MFKPDNDDNALAAMAGALHKQGISKEDRDRRDMFAAAAMTGILASNNFWESMLKADYVEEGFPNDVLAGLSILYADTIIEELKKSS